MTAYLRAAWLATWLPVAAALGWSGFDVTEGPLRLLVEEVPEVTDVQASVPVRVRLENRGQTRLEGTVEIRDLVDAWQVEGDAARPFALEPAATQSVDFRIRSGQPVFSALYPVHAYARWQAGADSATVHAVRIFAVKLGARDEVSSSAPALTAVPVPQDGGLPLWQVRTSRVAWRYEGEPLVYHQPGWTGSDPTSRANASVQSVNRGGDTRLALNIHPPYVPRAGSVFCDYRLALPDQTPIRLSFANAIRDSSAKEPASDGVLFRVWAGEADDGADATLVFECFTAAKTWTPGQVDLDAFAGRTILLRFEGHPGPAADTTCDSGYWAEPLVGTGRCAKPIPPSTATPAETVAENERVAADLLTGQAKPDGRSRFRLDPIGADRPAAVVVHPGSMGLLDAVFTLATPQGVVSFHGLNIDIEERPAGRWPGTCPFREAVSSRPWGTQLRVLHKLESDGRPVSLVIGLRADGPALRIAVTCDRRITAFSVGSWTHTAARVFYGHGYAVTEPEAFRVGFGGHGLASSHVGFEFEGGPAILQATDNPPDALVVDPARRVYALPTHLNATLTLLPGPDAMACAVAYRPLLLRRPASGVRRLAGRFCFDIWGGRYAQVVDQMQRMFRYGLTDSILTLHSWQRWGYDYRLPDVYPPNPALGTVEDLQRLGADCRRHDVPWGLHDNYIDFYPDAEGFSYEHIYFNRDGRPVPAWYNEGRDAQSYKFRPDHIQPFVERNFRLVRQDLKPTHAFLDVFTSTNCVDYWDWQGGYHSFLETRQHWGQAFAWIRDYLGDNAPTTSEAGHDQLVGYLDGADCQWLRLDRQPQRFVSVVPCREWEYVPWYDTVNHARFILHGVGYSNRFQGGRPRDAHGITSDDYLSLEVLSGHALMADSGCWGRPAVRKYYLAQDLVRHLALQTITAVEFVDGDLRHQCVTWADGSVVHVNRGDTDWSVDGRVLPRYGFLAHYGEHLAAVEKRDGRWAELSAGPSGWYANARATVAASPACLRVAPHLENAQYAGGSTVSWTWVWDAEEPAPADLSVFVHFCARQGKRDDVIVFQDDHLPPVPTSQWRGPVRIERRITVPDTATGEFRIMVGLHNHGTRAQLQCAQDGDSRVFAGTLTVERQGGAVTAIRFTPPPPLEWRAEPPPANPPGTEVDFGFAVTDGAFRVQTAKHGLRLIPLPDSPAFRILLRLPVLAGKAQAAKSVMAVPVDESAAEAAVEFTQTPAGDLAFAHDGKAFAYDIAW